MFEWVRKMATKRAKKAAEPTVKGSLTVEAPAPKFYAPPEVAQQVEAEIVTAPKPETAEDFKRKWDAHWAHPHN